jgi:hypothetical protein
MDEINSTFLPIARVVPRELPRPFTFTSSLTPTPFYLKPRPPSVLHPRVGEFYIFKIINILPINMDIPDDINYEAQFVGHTYTKRVILTSYMTTSLRPGDELLAEVEQVEGPDNTILVRLTDKSKLRVWRAQERIQPFIGVGPYEPPNDRGQPIGWGWTWGRDLKLNRLPIEALASVRPVIPSQSTLATFKPVYGGKHKFKKSTHKKNKKIKTKRRYI